MTLLELPAVAGSVYLFAVAWPLSQVDIREHRLPNRLVLPAIPITILGLGFSALLLNQWLLFAISVGTAIAAFGIGLAVNTFASLGMGDVKLISATSLALAWFNPLSPLIAIVIACATAASVIFFQLIRGRTSLGESVALGPYLLIGFAVTQILNWSTYFGGFASINFL